jgi:hypothetical protein
MGVFAISYKVSYILTSTAHAPTEKVLSTTTTPLLKEFFESEW